MPIFWKYLTKSYIKVFLLSTFGFICILLVTRLKEIAKFYALNNSSHKVILYALYQIPHILPIAIPISCMISAFLLFQKFSSSCELTALRAGGLSIKKIITPIILISFFISFLNFFIISELTPFCRINSKKISRSEITLNPIMLLERQKLLTIKNAYIDLKPSNDKIHAKNLIFIIQNKSNNRLNFLFAKKIFLKENSLIGENVSIISHFDNENKKNFDTLVIENQDIMTTHAKNLSKYMKPNNIPLNPLHLSTKMPLAREKVNKNKKNQKYISSNVEILRRLILSFSAFSFTFIGICFGIEIRRVKSKSNLFFAAFYALFILISFTVGKAFKYHPILSSLIYITPQTLILIFSTKALKKISGGIE